ncbi:MAG TPA: M1 family metallopeptidase [Fimbriimonas sp.]|nr:M1 family metallopeptidase [Fimbriimonas sp.]
MVLAGLLVGTSILAPDVRPPHEFDLLDVAVNLNLDFKNEAISGYVINKLRTTKRNAVLSFDKGPMSIQAIEVRGATAASKTVTANHVTVALRNAPAGTPVSVVIRYSAKPEAGIYFVPKARSYPGNTDLVFTQGEMEDTRYWIPTYDYPDDKATTSTTITVPKGMNVLSNGYLASKKAGKSTTTYKWVMDKEMVTYLISVVAGDYVSVPDGMVDKKPVNIWVPRGLESWGKAAFGGTDSMIREYQRLTGVAYPWAKYSQSAVPEFMFGGMENASCTTQTIGAIFPPNSAGSESADGLNAHELAHQWFGDLITCTSWSHIWVNEGWATFMPHFITRQRDGEDAFHISRYGTYQGGKGGAYGNPMVRSDYTIPMEMFDGNAYPGGATRMFMLMHMLGEDQFWKSTKTYLNQFAHKNVTTEQFFASWSKSTGRDLDGFRKQWFYTKGVPRIVVKDDGEYYSFTQTTPGYTVDVDVELLSPDGLVGRKTLTLEPNTPMTLNKTGSTYASVDPGAWLMCDIVRTAVPDDSVLPLWRSADNAAQKMRLLDDVSKIRDRADDLYAFEASFAVKNELIGHLKNRDTLVDLVKNGTPVQKPRALNRLSAISRDDAIALATEIWESSPNESLKNTAVNLLVYTKNNVETAEKAWSTKTYNLATKSAALNWFANNDKDRARKMALDAVRNFAPGPVRLTAISVLGRVKDEPGKREVFNLLVSLAKGRAYTPMNAAVGALADYGDKAAIPVLESRKNHSLHFGRNSIESALARLNR